jgi:hypothetical protein
MVALSWALALLNLQLPLEKIASSLLLPQPWPLYAMPLESLPSYIVAKAISASALQLLNVYLGYATLYPLVHLLRCRQALPHRF